MIIIGLTGSIGMGKSTTAKMFADEGVPVHDADDVVHKLYKGYAVPLIESAFPNTTKNGSVDRKALAKVVLGNSAALKKLETLVHPLVSAEREKFLSKAKKNNEDLVVLDIPLLFETGMDKFCEIVVVVTTTLEDQKQRVLARKEMSEEKFAAILAKQLPDVEKRKRADYIVDTSNGIDQAKQQVLDIINTLRS